jgi:hypothetical protein
VFDDDVKRPGNKFEYCFFSDESDESSEEWEDAENIEDVETDENDAKSEKEGEKEVSSGDK